MVRGETDEETNDLKTRQCMARCVEALVSCSKKQSEQKCAVEKPKLDHVRQLHGIFFIVCFGDDSHQRDARHSHHCEDRRDAEIAH